MNFLRDVNGAIKRRLPGAKKRQEALRILNSTYFDYEYYAHYLIGRTSDLDAIRAHYLSIGHASGISPTRYFSSSYYLFQCRLKNVELPTNSNPFQHYLSHGFALGLDPHPLISNSWYLDRFPEVAKANMEPVSHFINFGLREGRHLTPWYSQKFEPDSLRYFADPMDVVVDQSIFLSKLQARVTCTKSF